MSIEKKSRRDFIGFSLGAIGAIGAGFGLYAMKRTWDPLPSVEASGITKVDISPIQDGELHQVTWRKQAVLILKKTAEMPKNDNRDVVVNDSRYLIVIASCTHLGCIPEWNASTHEFVCACHGGVFDASGVNVFGPPPRPLDIPPFSLDGTTLTLGVEGPLYKKLTGKA